MYGDLKFTFIDYCVKQYLDSVGEHMRREMDRLKVNETGAGRASIRGTTVPLSESSVQGQLIFKEYLRFVDMGVRKGVKGKQQAVRVGGMEYMKVTLQSGASGVVTKKAQKPKKIYSKIAYGKLSWLHSKLMYGFTEETIAMLKKELTIDNG